MSNLAELEAEVQPGIEIEDTFNKPGLYLKEIKVKDEYKGKVPERITKALFDITKRKPFYKGLLPFVDGNLLGYTSYEINRGCHNSCRFCMASAVHKPYREHPLEALLDNLEETPKYLGCSNIVPYGLNYSGYSQKNELAREMTTKLNKGVTTSTQRVDTFSVELSKALADNGNRGATFAIEGGSQRLRNVVNKEITRDNIITACKALIDQRYTRLKLYMISNLPTETEEDRREILDILAEIQEYNKQAVQEAMLNGEDYKGLKIRVSFTEFTAKPWTALQWADVSDWSDKLEYVYNEMTKLEVVYQRSISGTNHALLQLYNRVDRRFCDVVAEAVINYGVEYTAKEIMKGKDLEGLYDRLSLKYTGHHVIDFLREIPLDKTLPWDILDTGMDKEWLKNEYLKSKKAELTPSCMKKCSQCGVCTNPNIKAQGGKVPVYHLKNKDISEEELIEAVREKTKRVTFNKLAVFFKSTPEARFIPQGRFKMLMKSAFAFAGIDIKERIEFLTEGIQFDNWTYGKDLAIIRTNKPTLSITQSQLAAINKRLNNLLVVSKIKSFSPSELSGHKQLVDYILYKTKLNVENVDEALDVLNKSNEEITIKQRKRGTRQGRIEYAEMTVKVHLIKAVKVAENIVRVYLALPIHINPYDTIHTLLESDNKRKLFMYPMEKLQLVKIPLSASIMNRPCTCGNLKETNEMGIAIGKKCLSCLIEDNTI